MTDRMQAFRAHADANGWVCPNPMHWNSLWEMLPHKHRQGSGWIPPLPPILAAWWDTPILVKKLCFLEHLEWAEKRGAADAVIDFLESLSPTDWYKA
jgi:hypothetical protein